jgi:hypothetical protein
MDAAIKIMGGIAGFAILFTHIYMGLVAFQYKKRWGILIWILGCAAILIPLLVPNLRSNSKMKRAMIYWISAYLFVIALAIFIAHTI